METQMNARNPILARWQAAKLDERIQAVKKVVDEQAEDEGLWFFAQTAPEAYLQQELRRLHTVFETGIDPRND